MYFAELPACTRQEGQIRKQENMAPAQKAIGIFCAPGQAGGTLDTGGADTQGKAPCWDLWVSQEEGCALGFCFLFWGEGVLPCPQDSGIRESKENAAVQGGATQRTACLCLSVACLGRDQDEQGPRTNVLRATGSPRQNKTPFSVGQSVGHKTVANWARMSHQDSLNSSFNSWLSPPDSQQIGHFNKNTSWQY